MTCGDSQCDKSYGFIGVGRGIGRGENGTKITYADAWKSFERSLTSARVPCTSIKRYPVVARWRDDVDFVQAGIYCFQPYCVTGELDPPANPLICPQFCMRFNDLDNIGITGRHYSGFIMLGIQVFNKPNDFKFWADECVEFNYRWLTEELKIHPDEITFIEDVWAGGGNLGPSIEYFVSGLEVGNMVFMQYKTFPDGSREPLQVQVIDVGIGLERIPWLINGSATSYLDVFPSAYKYFLEKTEMKVDNAIWEKFGPLSCLLNVDEVDDMPKMWQWVADKINMSVAEVRSAIEPVRDMYIVLDHTRTMMMAIQDGSLPANTGGGSNIRNVIRRAFALLHKNKWWDKLGVQGILDICACHQKDLATIYGEFPPYSSFPAIIEREYNLYKSHDVEQRKQLDRIVAKTGAKGLSLDDWILCVTTFGIPDDYIQQVTGQTVPQNLWYEIDYRQQQTMKAAAPQLYSTAALQPTISLYDDDHDHTKMDFDGAKVVEVFPLMTSALPEKPLSVVVLDKSPFYPTSGGQDHDTGVLTIDGKEYAVVDVIRVGPCVLHTVVPPFEDKSVIGKSVSGAVDRTRRDQLRVHHTATHLIYATARKVLGPHVWQNGARKKVTEAHLDITHYSSLSHEQLLEIEREANRAVRAGKTINKSTQAKDTAEQKFGFHLYQGGVVPGNTLRIVNIEDTDTEACCGTHCDNTSEVGIIKMIGARRVTDGIVRLTYVAGERALHELGTQSTMLNRLCENLDTQVEHVVDSATNFFKMSQKLKVRSQNLSEKVLELQLALITKDANNKLFLSRTDEPTVSMFLSRVPNAVEKLKANGQGVIFLGDDFIYGLMGDEKLVDTAALLAKLKEYEARQNELNAKHHAAASSSASSSTSGAADAESKAPTVKPAELKTMKEVSYTQGEGKKGKKVKVSGVLQFTSFQVYSADKMFEYLKSLGAVEI